MIIYRGISTVDCVMFATPGLAQSTSSSTVSPLCTKQGGPTVPSHLEYIFILFGKTETSLHEVDS